MEVFVLDILIVEKKLNDLNESGETFKVRIQPLLRKVTKRKKVSSNSSKKNDLIIPGLIRPGSNRLYLGTRLEKILQQAQGEVIVFNV